MMRISMSFLRVLLPVVLAVASMGGLSAQNAKLADQYYLEGEYAKAADLYLKLHDTAKKTNNFTYFNKYVECLLAMRSFDRAEREIREQMTLQPDDYSLLVTLGNVQERVGRYEDAQASYRQAIDKLPPRIDIITRLGNAFLTQAKYDEAIETYEKGEELLGQPGAFAYNLADLYQRNGDIPNMITQYLYALNANPTQLENIQMRLQRALGQDDYKLLMEQLYSFIQQYPDTDHFPEMLAWTFIQQKDYSKAMRQAKALDRRLGENGQRVFRLAQIAANARDYATAIDGFEYILGSYPPNSPYFIEAKRNSLATKRNQITDSYTYSPEQLRALEAEYVAFIDQYGLQPGMAMIASDLALLRALYIHDLPAAIDLLEDVIALPGINPYLQALIKLDLGDYNLMAGEVWESTLLYSQVDKAYPEELIGQDARFRNAKLSYYNGDFEWAQTQFDILKTSTSKLIANDALDLSVFIMDNLGLDSTTHAMAEYAQAELLIFQNKLEEAIDKLTILGNLYSEHGLQDDILYLKAQLYARKREFTTAEAMYKEIYEKYPEDIRADNALFHLAELYMGPLNDKAKAQELYEKIFVDYSDSTFAIEARKRFREMRGDFDAPMQ
jgi:tetratricopeptide (TPR) repeat protein